MRHMKTVSVVVLLMLFSLSGIAQKVTINYQKVNLEKVFSEITKQTNLSFVYSQPAVDVNKTVSIDAKNMDVRDVLGKVLAGTDISYELSDGKIYLKAKSVASSQTTQSKHKVTGVVKDDTGEALVGVSVTERGTQNVVITDLDGRYTIHVADPNASIVFSYIGFGDLGEHVKGRSSINATLTMSSLGLEEVIVVAYGTQRRSTVSGSLTTVEPTKIISTAPTMSAMLQGQVAGMNVSVSSGSPGSGGDITIRGKGSISSGTSPLWVVDGIVGGTTSSLNPNDIETMTVLKDGSATALYGSRGANGVIVVTTKKAKMGENRIDVSAKVGVTNLSRGKFKMMDSNELYEYTDQMFKNSGMDPYPWFTPALMDNNTDWYDLVTQTALTTNYNVAYHAGKEKVRSYMAADYYNEEGTVKGSNYERFTLRNNVVYKFNDKLNINSSISGNYSNSSSRKSGSLYAAGTYLPWDTPYNSLGEIKTGREGQDIATGKPMSDYWFGRDASNYMHDSELNWSTSKTLGVDISLGFDYTIIDGLVFESTNNFGYSAYTSKGYTDPKSFGGLADGGTISNSNQYNRNRYTNQLLRYNKTFNRVHEVSAFLGHEYSDSWVRTNSLVGKGIPQGGEVAGVASEPKSVNGDEYFIEKIEGYYFNSNYTFDNRYFAQVSFRRDGSSKFGADKRYGNFWTVGGGWNMHNETFINRDIIDQLKIRASYGVTGNTPGNTFLSLYLYDLNREYDQKPGAFPRQMGNPKMSWETAKSTNIGVDMRFYDRIGLSVDYYIKNVSGLLYSRVLSTLSGYTNVWLNEGRLQNSGVEFTLSPEIIRTKDWNWTVDFNFAYNKNEIKSLADAKEREIAGNEIREVGYALGTYYTREWGGVDVMSGNPTWVKVGEDGTRTYVLNEAEANPQNLNITRYPDITGGAQTRLSYKDFTLSATFSYAAGFYINHFGRTTYDNDGAEAQYNSMKLKDGWSRWEKPGDHATHPKPMIGGNKAAHRESSRQLERGDFFKMKTLGLSYNIPQKLLSNIGIRSAQISFSADNIFTITNFSGTDPEVAVNGGSYDASAYPLPKKYMFSLSLGF